MEQLVIFLLFVIGSIISAVIQNKKKKAEELQQRELEELTRRPGGQAGSIPPQTRTSQAPQAPWPRTAADWQEQLRRMLEGETAPPVIIKPVLLPHQSTPQKPPVVAAPKKPVTREVSEGDLVFKSPLHTSTTNYQRAANLQATVEDRMRAVGEQRVKHTTHDGPRAHPRPHSAFVQRLKQNPRASREAFIASIIFAPPQGLEQDATRPIR